RCWLTWDRLRRRESRMSRRNGTDVEERIADLERKIERGELRLLVSFAIQSFVEGPFDYDTDSVVPIIDDVVGQWGGLTAAESRCSVGVREGGRRMRALAPPAGRARARCC